MPENTNNQNTTPAPVLENELPIGQEPEWMKDFNVDPFGLQDEPDLDDVLKKRMAEEDAQGTVPIGNTTPRPAEVVPEPLPTPTPAQNQQPSAADVLVNEILAHRSNQNNAQYTAAQQAQLQQLRQQQENAYAQEFYNAELVDSFGEQQGAVLAKLLARTRLNAEEQGVRRAMAIVQQQLPQVTQLASGVVAGQQRVQEFFTAYPKLAKPQFQGILQHVAQTLAAQPDWGQKTPGQRQEETAKAAYAELDWAWGQSQEGGNNTRPTSEFAPPRPIGLNGGGNGRASAHSGEEENEFTRMANSLKAWDMGLG